jgi:hypothetical protein
MQKDGELFFNCKPARILDTMPADDFDKLEKNFFAHSK